MDMAVTMIPVAGPKIIKLAREMPKFTETLPVFGRGAERLSEMKIKTPKIITPNNETFLYLRRTYTKAAIPNAKIMKT